MGKLSGLPIAGILVAVALAGCASEPEPPPPPPPTSDDVLFFNGQRCLAAHAQALTEPSQVSALLPDGFVPVAGPGGQATVGLHLQHCEDGRANDVSLELDVQMNFWFIGVYVSAPEWAATPNATQYFVLGFYTSDPFILRGFAPFNVTVLEGVAEIENLRATSAEGAVGLELVAATGEALGETRRHYLPLANGSIAAWDSRDAVRSGGGQAMRVTADPGTLWATITAPSTVATGWTSDNYRFGPGTIQWIGPPAPAPLDNQTIHR